MDNETPKPPPRGVARRRLLRGALAAPAVLTLVSGSALAATSASCVVKQNGTPMDAPAPFVSGEGSEVWVRVPLYELRTGDDFVQFVSGSNINGILPPGGDSYLGNSEWQCVGKGGPGTTYQSIAVGDKVTTPQPTPTLVTGQFVAVRIDTAGHIIGVQGLQTSGTAMHVSCWTSFGGLNLFG